jgi:hypothetical protein
MQKLGLFDPFRKNIGNPLDMLIKLANHINSPFVDTYANNYRRNSSQPSKLIAPFADYN